MSEHPLERLRGQIAAGELDTDAAQLEVTQRLDTLARRLERWRPGRAGLVRSVLGRAAGRPPRGVYIHGPVGRGKTMLMDLFFELAEVTPKARCHFHEFMADAHEKIGAARRTCDGDPIPVVANAIADEAALLCFDEMQVTDIADAMILGRLFKHMFARGVVVVATSNQPPGALYKDGLNRQLFLPCIDLLETHMEVIALQAAKDYRLDKLAGLQLYFTPADGEARAALDAHWERLTGGHPGRPETLKVKGRDVRVPLASMGIARFAFDDLCEEALGALDYLHVAHAYHTVLIDAVPILAPQRRAATRRFINLIDTLYDNGICLIASADAEPSALYPQGPEAEAFERAASRLMEMRSKAYLASRHGQQRAVGVGQ